MTNPEQQPRSAEEIEAARNERLEQARGAVARARISRGLSRKYEVEDAVSNLFDAGIAPESWGTANTSVEELQSLEFLADKERAEELVELLRSPEDPKYARFYTPDRKLQFAQELKNILWYWGESTVEDRKKSGREKFAIRPEDIGTSWEEIESMAAIGKDHEAS